MKNVPHVTVVSLIMLLAVPAYAAPLPPMPAIPTVTRPAPLLSPKAASAPKTTPMFIPASSSQRIPMMAEIAPAADGQITLLVDALKPANVAMTFEYSTFVAGPWERLQYWSAYPEEQWVGLAWTTAPGDLKFVRATHVAEAFEPVSARIPPPRGVVLLPPSKTKPSRLQ